MRLSFSQGAGRLFMDKRPLFPIFLDLSEKTVVLIGAGTIAKRRLRTLLDFAGRITLVAPEVNAELLAMEAEGKVRLIRRHYRREDLFDADLVIAASASRKENMEIHAACKCLGIPVNIPNDRRRSDFIFPSVVRKNSLVAGVTSGGTNPAAAKKLVERIKGFLLGNGETIQ